MRLQRPSNLGQTRPRNPSAYAQAYLPPNPPKYKTRADFQMVQDRHMYIYIHIYIYNFLFFYFSLLLLHLSFFFLFLFVSLPSSLRFSSSPSFSFVFLLLLLSLSFFFFFSFSLLYNFFNFISISILSGSQPHRRSQRMSQNHIHHVSSPHAQAAQTVMMNHHQNAGASPLEP